MNFDGNSKTAQIINESTQEISQARSNCFVVHDPLYSFKSYTSSDGSTSTDVGIKIFSGQPCIEEARMMSYGAFLDADVHCRKTTFEYLQAVTGKDINKDNYISFIPKYFLDQYGKKDIPAPIEISKEQGTYNGEKLVDYFVVTHRRRFGVSMSVINRYEDGYHAFSVKNAKAGIRYLMINYYVCPTLDEINNLLEEKENWDVYDRKLSREEFCYFLNTFFSLKDDISDTVNDMYGMTDATHEYSVDGQVTSNDVTSRFAQQMSDCIYDIAKCGVKLV